jgi:YHS domain-containing protein
LHFAQVTSRTNGAGLARRVEPPESAEGGVAFLARIVQILLWLVIATWLARRLVNLFASRAPKAVHPPGPPAPKQLHRDPWCGTHVSAEISHPLEQAGQTVHFCSAECRERYRASQQRAASG